MTDDMLECRAVSFLGFSVEQLCKVSFEQFLTQPDSYMTEAVNLLYSDRPSSFISMNITIGLICH